MITKSKVRCAIYTRKSTEEGLDQDFNSLDAQRESGAAYILSQKAEGWLALPQRYDDGGYSGGTLERPALGSLLTDIEAGNVDVVVVYKIDRLSRSLMDFAKLVEVFDRKGVTFVSVTQSFNTTTSMGRLTLNILLSFAQFEREVTGERIRDKFAASKKKGIWMGGNPPLGYDVVDRKLVVNEAEAVTVRFIFQRYLDLGCVRLLCSDLAKQGIVSKKRRFFDGRTRGGQPFGRSGLYLVLNNRSYLGQTTHKGQTYPGEHQAIVSQELFNRVQRRLAELAPPVNATIRSSQDGPYTGILFDATGVQMRPTYTVKPPRMRYRYYASRSVLKGEKSEAAITRIPAPIFEAFMAEILARLGFTGKYPPAALRRVDVLANSIVLRFNVHDVCLVFHPNANGTAHRTQNLVEQWRSKFDAGWTVTDNDSELVLTIPVRAQFRGGRTGVSDPTTHKTQPDMAMIKALARAHRWRQMLLDGQFRTIEELAERYSLDRGHLRLTLKLAFLSPKLARAILRGEQPSGLRLTHLVNADIPSSWEEQEAWFASVSINGIKPLIDRRAKLASDLLPRSQNAS